MGNNILLPLTRQYIYLAFFIQELTIFILRWLIKNYKIKFKVSLSLIS